MKKKKSEAYASEYCMSAGDNAVSREQINASITTPAAANEHMFRKALQQTTDKQ